jgi:hypothetical protein
MQGGNDPGFKAISADFGTVRRAQMLNREYSPVNVVLGG